MLQIAVITADFDDMPFSDQSAARSDWREIRRQIWRVLNPFKAFNIEDLKTVSVAFNSKSDTNSGLKAQITVNASFKGYKKFTLFTQYYQKRPALSGFMYFADRKIEKKNPNTLLNIILKS